MSLGKISNALGIAAMISIAFAGPFFVFLVATTFMLLPITGVILGFTVKLLGVPFEGGLVSVVIFWSLLVFLFTFVFVAIRTSGSKYSITSSNKWDLPVGIISIAIVTCGCIYLVKNHNHESALVDEKKLAMEFVKNNDEVIKTAGRNLEIGLVGAPAERSIVKYYEIGIYVHGAKPLFAIVNVYRDSGQPVFTLTCLTPLSMGYRDPFKPPCKQQNQ